jgi:hypothetical protein
MRRSQAWIALAALLVVALSTRTSTAAPEAHFLRVDPRAGQTDGAPILTTVVEVVQTKRMSDVTQTCAALTGNDNLDCMARALEQPGALYQSFDFPDKNAIMTVSVDGSDVPARFESKARWAESANQPGVGTAFLILIDAAASMGSRLEDAKAVANGFVSTMTPNDIVDVMVFNDRGVVQDSKWVNNKQAALATIAAAHTYPSQGRSRPLFNILKQAATDSFGDLGNTGTITVPLHQTMVVLSNGAAGTDTSSNQLSSTALRQFFTKGRFPEDNQVRPKMPVPVVSIWFPSRAIEEFMQNSREFMEGLANPEIGGLYSVSRDGAGSHATNIVAAVRTRIGKMHIVKWRVACIAPTITQSFKLVFANTTPPMAGDSWENVPVGIDPTTWPLDVDRDATDRAAKSNPIYPGGTVKIFGNFCWGGTTTRAELYMVPKNQAAPQTLQGGGIDDARKAQRSLIEQGMRGKAITATDTYVEFDLPSSEKFLVKSGETFTGRLIIYDNAARRTSAITADKIITLRAQEAPLPYLWIGGGTFAGVVVLLLIVSIVRGGGGGNKRRGGAPAAPPPRPVVAGAAPAPMAYGAPPPMGGGMGGGMPDYGAPPPMMGPASRATLSGTAGVFTVMPGMEMYAGRDGAVCQIMLTEPRVSGKHGGLKIEGGQLLVRDEGSNNGSFVNGQRIQAHVWTPVANGATLRFGPVEFSVRLE